MNYKYNIYCTVSKIFNLINLVFVLFGFKKCLPSFALIYKHQKASPRFQFFVFNDMIHEIDNFEIRSIFFLLTIRR